MHCTKNLFINVSSLCHRTTASSLNFWRFVLPSPGQAFRTMGKFSTSALNRISYSHQYSSGRKRVPSIRSRKDEGTRFASMPQVPLCSMHRSAHTSAAAPRPAARSVKAAVPVSAAHADVKDLAAVFAQQPLKRRIRCRHALDFDQKHAAVQILFPPRLRPAGRFALSSVRRCQQQRNRRDRRCQRGNPPAPHIDRSFPACVRQTPRRARQTDCFTPRLSVSAADGRSDSW